MLEVRRAGPWDMACGASHRTNARCIALILHRYSTTGYLDIFKTVLVEESCFYHGVPYLHHVYI